jgi:hypothetical protein
MRFPSRNVATLDNELASRVVIIYADCCFRCVAFRFTLRAFYFTIYSRAKTYSILATVTTLARFSRAGYALEQSSPGLYLRFTVITKIVHLPDRFGIKDVSYRFTSGIYKSYEKSNDSLKRFDKIVNVRAKRLPTGFSIDIYVTW